MPGTPALPARARLAIAASLSALAIASVVAAVVGLWPAHLAGDSLRLRIAAAFVAYGLVLVAVLLVALAIKKLVLRR